MLQHSLPLSLEADWRNEPSHLIADLLSQWLFEQGSLTQKLQQQCTDFRVKLLNKHERNLNSDELLLFGYDMQNIKVQVREVLLYCDDVPWVYAQTLMPLDHIPPAIDKLLSLGEKPLGEVIFNEPGVVRSAIEVAEFAADSHVVELISEVDKVAQHSLWGRRSTFTLDGYSLLVCEVYLPSAKVY